MKVKLERNKIPGVCYVINNQGIELPVVDITHPSFALKMSDEELNARVNDFILSAKKLEKMPKFFQRFFLFFFFRCSLVGRGFLAAESNFLSAMNTYFMKIGSENLGKSYASRFDRKMAQNLPIVSVRLRLQDIAHLIAEETISLIKAHPNLSLNLINIAGGPAIDTLNALILMQRENPSLLSSRRIEIYVLDLEEEGPQFGEKAAAALTSEGSVLENLDLHFHYLKYDWANVTVLEDLINALKKQPGIVVASSEGGLFEYGSDEVIVNNLKALKRGAAFFVGSVTRADGPSARVRFKDQNFSPLLLKPRTLDSFCRLAKLAGWKIACTIEQPMNYNVRLLPEEETNQ